MSIGLIGDIGKGEQRPSCVGYSEPKLQRCILDREFKIKINHSFFAWFLEQKVAKQAENFRFLMKWLVELPYLNSSERFRL